VTDKGEEAMRRLDKAIEGMVKMGLKKIQVLLVPRFDSWPGPWGPGVTKRCRLSWLTNSALVFEPKCGGRGGVAGSQPMSTAVNMEAK
jgi:hypothetical protein